MPVPVTEEQLIVLVDVVIEASGTQVLARVVVKQSAIRLQLTDQIVVDRVLRLRQSGYRADSQSKPECPCAGLGGKRNNCTLWSVQARYGRVPRLGCKACHNRLLRVSKIRLQKWIRH